MNDFRQLIQSLLAADVEFIIVGGVAAVVHGSARSTQDLDVVYRRTPENLARVVRAFQSRHPYPRGAPPGLPFVWDAKTLTFGLNFTLRTDGGFIDLLGEITGGGGYEQLLPFTISTPLFGKTCLCLDLLKLIAVKRAAGRPKDFEAVAELELIRDQRPKPST